MADSKESRSERVSANCFCPPESQVVRWRENYHLSNIFRSMRLSRLFTFVFHLTFFPKAHNPCLFHFRCVLNWFGDWSTGALYQVGKEFTSKIDLEKSNVRVILHKPWSHLQGRLLVESCLFCWFRIRYFFRFAEQKSKQKSYSGTSSTSPRHLETLYWSSHFWPDYHKFLQVVCLQSI